MEREILIEEQLEICLMDHKEDYLDGIEEIKSLRSHTPLLLRELNRLPEGFNISTSMYSGSLDISVRGIRQAGDLADLIQVLTDSGWEVASTSDGPRHRKWMLKTPRDGSGNTYLFLYGYLGDDHDCIVEEVETPQDPKKTYRIICPGSPEIKYEER